VLKINAWAMKAVLAPWPVQDQFAQAMCSRVVILGPINQLPRNPIYGDGQSQA
jgi:hypothetical protein